MPSSESSQKRTRVSFFDEISGFDLFYQLTHMSAIAEAGLSRDKIFEFAAHLPSKVSKHFQEIDVLAGDLHYDYPQACRMVGTRVKQDATRSFLLRLSDVLKSGEPVGAFLVREAGAQGEHYSNEYERDLESLKKWTDGYSSLIISEALIVIINLVSTMIYNLGSQMMAGLMAVAVLMSFFGAWILSRAAPKEIIPVSAPGGCPDQILARKLLMLIAPPALLLSALLLQIGAPMGWVLILSSVLLFPIGMVSVKSDQKLAKRETEIGSFLRSLGGMATSTGTTVTEALNRMDLESFPNLSAQIQSLATRLRARIDPRLCWERFGSETGSLLISQAIGMFHAAVSLGGDPDEVSAICSRFTTQTAMLRAKRRIVTATFSGLTMVMHGALALLLVIVLEIVHKFRDMVTAAIDPGQAQQAMKAVEIPLLTFSEGDVKFLSQMTIGMVLVLVLVNAAAILATDGGFKPKVCLYLSVLLVISAVSFFAGPMLMSAIL